MTRVFLKLVAIGLVSSLVSSMAHGMQRAGSESKENAAREQQSRDNRSEIALDISRVPDPFLVITIKRAGPKGGSGEGLNYKGETVTFLTGPQLYRFLGAENSRLLKKEHSSKPNDLANAGVEASRDPASQAFLEYLKTGAYESECGQEKKEEAMQEIGSPGLQVSRETLEARYFMAFMKALNKEIDKSAVAAAENLEKTKRELGGMVGRGALAILYVVIVGFFTGPIIQAGLC